MVYLDLPVTAEIVDLFGLTLANFRVKNVREALKKFKEDKSITTNTIGLTLKTKTLEELKM